VNVQRLAAARLWATERFPYFAAGLFALDAHAALGLGTMAVDRRWRLYIDPEVLETWTVPECGAVLIHELYHVLRSHSERADAAGVGPDEALAWNIACDAEINDELVAIGLPLPGAPVLPKTIGCKDDLLAEAYYAAIDHDLEWFDCGSGAHGHHRAWDLTPGGLDRADVELVRRQVALEVKAAHAAGKLPAGLARWAEGQLEQRVDWRRALAAEVRRAIGLVSGRVDYSYRRPSRRSLPNVVLPTFVRPVPSVAIVVDTSSSMSAHDLGRCLTEVDGIIMRIGLRSVGVPVIACDAAVHDVTRVVDAGRVRLGGGGGTNMGAGIEHAAQLRPRPEVLVVLTDGYTPWPVAPPRSMRVVVGLLDGTGDAPPWARRVVICD
jgi:predicted metal-dependent peptidase